MDSKVRLRYSFTPTFAYADLSSMNLTNAEQKLEWNVLPAFMIPMTVL